MFIPLLVLAPLVADAYPVKPAWRGDSLPPGVYLGTSGHGGAYNCPGSQCGFDLMAVRFHGSGWSKLKSSAGPDVKSGPNATPNSEYLGWEMPFYSPVDGEVIACARWIPDDPDDNNLKPAECSALAGGDCLTGGNQLWIRTWDGNIVFLGHLQFDSIPEELCPIPEDTPLQVVSPASCSLGGTWDELKDAVKLDPFVMDYPVVETGDFIGRMGNSGGTSAPHLHLGVYDYWEHPSSGEACYADVPYEFTEAWDWPMGDDIDNVTVDVTSADWERLEGDVLVFNGDTHLILPDPVGPRMDLAALTSGSSPALALTSKGGVAVYRGFTNALTAKGFTFDVNDEFDFGTGSTDNGIFAVDVAPISTTSGHVVAAARDTSGLLRMVPFYVELDGDLIKGTPKAEPTVTAHMVVVTRAPTHSGVVVAVKNATNDLSVIDYRSFLNGTTLALTKNDTVSTSNDVNEIDIATVNLGRGVIEDTGQWQGVVTAERSTNNTVTLRSWTVSSAGELTAADSRLALTQVWDVAYEVTDLDLAVTGGFAGREFVVLSTILAWNSHMRVSVYTIYSDGELMLVDQFDADAVTDAEVSSLSSSRSGLTDMVVGTRLSAGGSKLWSFNVDSSGTLRRVGAVDAETVAALVVGGRADDEDMVTLVSDSGLLGMTHHRTNYMWLH